ncbi:hypothetical protein CYY_009198 [Polysphondylium violaceum]|uniref:Uncharacterized protein n=1 Tax=Polysphondylium violaceum TaxID=133409 RepID=A0A8J4PM50_9MYCE|nr:hypothetical protein CYY_009198 [Polysphondylium violaceum]
MDMDSYSFNLLIDNPFIDDIFEFTKRICRASDNASKEIDVFVVELLIHKVRLLAISYKNGCSGPYGSFANDLVLACWFSPEIHEYLSTFLVGNNVMIGDRDSIVLDEMAMYGFQVMCFMKAVFEFDLEKIKSITSSWSTRLLRITYSTFAFDTFYASLACAKTFQQKRDAIVVGEYLKSQFRQLELRNAEFSSALVYFQDKAFYTEISRAPLENLSNIINGVMMGGGSFGQLKYLVENLTEIEYNGIPVEDVIHSFAVHSRGTFLKPILYLFEALQDRFKSESILDHLVCTAVEYDNHRLINILLHRTKIRLIKPKSEQHEQQILSRMKLVLKSALPHVESSTYFQHHADFEIDQPLLVDLFFGRMPISYSSTKVDPNVLIKTIVPEHSELIDQSVSFARRKKAQNNK